MKKKRNSLNLKEKKFVKAYVKGGGNGAAAAREAGYSDKAGGDRTHASHLLTKPNIVEAVETETQKALKAAELTDDHIRQGLMRESGLDGQGGPKDQQHGGRIRAMELLGKAQSGGMFTDKTVTEQIQLSGIELIMKLAQDGCPHMAVGACRDLGLNNLKTEQKLRTVSPEAADELLQYIPSVGTETSQPVMIEGTTDSPDEDESADDG